MIQEFINGTGNEESQRGHRSYYCKVRFGTVQHTGLAKNKDHFYSHCIMYIRYCGR